MEFSFDVLIKILLAIALGGLIGVEREIREKAAGFRTLIFICLGSSMFTMLSINFAGNHDTARIARFVRVLVSSVLALFYGSRGVSKD